MTEYTHIALRLIVTYRLANAISIEASSIPLQSFLGCKIHCLCTNVVFVVVVVVVVVVVFVGAVMLFIFHFPFYAKKN